MREHGELGRIAEIEERWGVAETRLWIVRALTSRRSARNHVSDVVLDGARRPWVKNHPAIPQAPMDEELTGAVQGSVRERRDDAALLLQLHHLAFGRHPAASARGSHSHGATERSRGAEVASKPRTHAAREHLCVDLQSDGLIR
jgi:hypothetical protein